MAKQWLDSFYIRGKLQYDPNTRSYVPITNDALLYTVKDTETLETTLHIMEKPIYEFYVAKKPQPFQKDSMPISDVRTVRVPFTMKDREIAMILGKLPEYQWAKKNDGMREYNKMIAKNPNIYGIDTNIEDFYKTKMIMENLSPDGEQTVAPVYNICFSDTEVDISNYHEDFPDPDVAPCPINLITNIYAVTKEAISYILYDERVSKEQQDIIEHPQKFIDEYLDPMILKEGFTFKFKVYDNELSMIRDYFKDIHIRKPEFCLWWNMAFDIPTIINRLKRLCKDETEMINIMCHPDVPEKYRIVRYMKDPKRTMFDTNDDEDDEDDEDEKEEDGRSKGAKTRPPPSRLVDVVDISGYTRHMCQMAMYSNMNKRFLLKSYRLDDIAKKVSKIGKYNLAENGYSIRDVNVKNFKIFLAYNIRDSFCQYVIERDTRNMNNCIIFTSNTRISKYHQQSQVVRNEIMFNMLKQNKVIGNAVDYGFTEKFEGALVGNPVLLEQLGIKSTTGQQTYVFEDLYDNDAESLYPNCLIENNITKASIYGRIIDIQDANGNSINNPKQLGEELQTIDQSIFDVCKTYMDLPTVEEMVYAIEGAAIQAAKQKSA